MRIECEVCGATYSIDDTQLTDQPIGAQCPYCGHVKLVQPADAAFPSQYQVPFDGGAPMAADALYGGVAQADGFFGQVGGVDPAQAGQHQQGAHADFTLQSPPMSFDSAAFNDAPAVDMGSEPLSPSAFADAFPANGGINVGAPSDTLMSHAAPQAVAPFGSAQGGFTGRSPAPPPAAVDYGYDMSGGFSMDGIIPPPRSPSTADRFAALEGTAEELPKCQVCGTTLGDEFDKVIGLCDVHQRDRRRGELKSSTSISAPPPIEVTTWHVRGEDGVPVGPISLEDLRARIRQGEFGKDSEYSKDARNYARMSRYQEIAYLGNLSAAAEGGGLSRPRAVSPRAQTSDTGRWLFGALAGVVALAALLFSFNERHRFKELYGRVSGSTAGREGVAATNPLTIMLPEWRAIHPDVDGSTAEHVAAARVRHLEDRWSSYAAAQAAYQRALLIDEDDPTTIAGYVENLVIWKYPLLSQEQMRIAQAALRFASDEEPNNPFVHRAQAAFALSRGDLDPCRAGADQALQRDASDGLAKLILAGCFLEGNVQLAVSEAEAARRLVPEMRRADRVLAEAYIKLGRWASAEKVLEQRLKTEPKNTALLTLMGTLQQDVGRSEKAEDFYKRAVDGEGDTQGAHLVLADLYMMRNDYARAVLSYRRAAEQQHSQPERAARAFAGWARAELGRKQLPEAVRVSDLALNLIPKQPEALLVRGEAALLIGSATVADGFARRALELRSGEPATLVLAGRTAGVLQLREQAIRHFEEALTNDPQDLRLKGILAAYYLEEGGIQQAYALMRKAAEIDPGQQVARTRVGPYALSRNAIEEAVAVFRRSATDEANASVAQSAIGMLEYHLGERVRAKDSIARALRLDDSNMTALLYEAQIAVDEGNAEAAQRAASRILSLERGSALGHLMSARAHARRNNIAAAQEQYTAALRGNPSLIAAVVERAGLRTKRGSKDSPVEELVRAFQLDPHHLPTRKLLYEAGY